MEPMSVEDMKEPRSTHTLLFRRQSFLILLNTVLLVTTTTLIAVVLHRVLQSKPPIPTVTVDKRFPGYFRSPEEQSVFERRLRERTEWPVNVNVTLWKKTCFLKCEYVNSTSSEPISPKKGLTYNGCCVSYPYYISPSYWEDITGINRTMATFQQKKQFFLTESCETVVGCSYCTCHQSIVPVTGVYVDGEDFNIGWFPIASCCKCINTV